MGRFRIWEALTAVALLAALVLWPDTAKAGAVEGLLLCGSVLVPALFPFSVGSGTLIRMGLAGWIGTRLEQPMRRIYHLPGTAAVPLCLGLLGGYPLGVSCLAELYRSGALTRAEAQRLSAFCNNAGPGFILGAVGMGVMQSPVLGLALWGIHILSALLTGRLLRGGSPDAVTIRRSGSDGALPLALALPQALTASADAMLRISGTVVFFSTVMRLAERALPIRRLPQVALAVLWGAAELTGGIFRLSASAAETRFFCCAVLLGWGGLCVHMQAADQLTAAGLSIVPVLRGKAVQAAISGLLAIAFLYAYSLYA